MAGVVLQKDFALKTFLNKYSKQVTINKLTKINIQYLILNKETIFINHNKGNFFVINLRLPYFCSLKKGCSQPAE